MPATAVERTTRTPRHALLVRLTHWATLVCFIYLVYTGAEIIISHPRFYWGETGNINMKPLFAFPIASSRGSVPTGYNYVMPDQNGWARALHFQSAWALLVTGAFYFAYGLFSGHFRRNLLPAKGQRSWHAFRDRIVRYLRFAPADPAEARSYNILQRTAYSAVVFILFPLVVWTGLALSPTFNAVFPFAVDILGGRQSARTLHLFVTVALVLFLLLHIIMVALAGFFPRMRSMITGRAPSAAKERP